MADLDATPQKPDVVGSVRRDADHGLLDFRKWDLAPRISPL
jgi:hypothetical protein